VRSIALDMMTAIVVTTSLLALALAADTAAASPHDPPGPLEDILDDRDLTRVDHPQRPQRHNHRIIDIDQMHANDCRLDRIHDGVCVMTWEDPLDGQVFGRDFALRYRWELVEQVLDTAELIDSLR
jgi:hypothetical protein